MNSANNKLCCFENFDILHTNLAKRLETLDLQPCFHDQVLWAWEFPVNTS